MQEPPSPDGSAQRALVTEGEGTRKKLIDVFEEPNDASEPEGSEPRQGAATEQGGDLTEISPARRVGVRFLQMYTFFAAPAKDDLYLLTTVYLVSVHGKTAGEVGSLQSLRDFGVAIGSVTAGYIIDRSRHKIEIAAVANVTSILGVIILLYTVDMGPSTFAPL